MSPAYKPRLATADDVVQHTTSMLTCPNGHTWELNPASLVADDGIARCWAPACRGSDGQGAPLTGVSAETLARRQLAARLHDAVVEQQRGQLHLAVSS